MILTPNQFDHIDQEQTQPLPVGSYTHFTDNQRHAFGKINSTIEQTFQPLEQNTTTHFMSCAHWSCHELLSWILAQTGPAAVTIGVWSISEQGAQKLTNLLQEGVITALEAVFDYRSKNRHPAAHQLASHSFTKIHTFPMHAKLTVVKNDTWSVLLNGSANYTNNPRPEAGLISTHKPTVDFYHDILKQLLAHGDPFK